MPDERKCRDCGCTHHKPCVDRDGYPCSWVAEDLCSACLPQEAWLKFMPAPNVACATALAELIADCEDLNGAMDETTRAFAREFFGHGFRTGFELGTLPPFSELPDGEPEPQIILPGDAAWPEDA